MKALAKNTKSPIRAGVPTVTQFLGNLTLGLDFLQTAGAQLVEMKKDDFDVFDRILAEADWLTREMLECIHKVGEKVLHPKLLLMPKHVFNHVAGLPYAEQEKALTMPVEVPPVPHEAPRRRIESKPASQLSRAEAGRVWGKPKGDTGAKGWCLTALSRKFTLYVELDQITTATVVPATHSEKAQVIILDENGEACVQFRKRVKKGD